MGVVLRQLAVALASALGFGYAPFAPGTFGTLAAIPLFWLSGEWPLPVRLAFTAGVFLLAVPIAHLAGQHYGEYDDQHIVIDEVAGYLVTVCLAPYNWRTALLGFVLFRLFDITKPWPARYFDRHVNNGFGCVMDDIVAGLFGLAVMTVVLRLGLVH